MQENLAIVVNYILKSRRKQTQRKVYVSCDLRKAYDSVSVEKLFLKSNQKSGVRQGKHLLQLIKELYKNRQVAKERRHSVFSFDVFNIYFEHALTNIPDLKEASEHGKLICFTDDKAEAEKLIGAMANSNSLN